MDKQHILVVDDNHINRLFFESSIKKLSYDVTVVGDGFEAVNLCESSYFDLILMDIRMNGIDGTQTAAIIKKLPCFQNVPILAISAEQFDHANNSDFNGSMLKPISQELLHHLLSKHLNKDKVFDHNMAMQFSNQDDEIVQKLRVLLHQQLPKDQLNLQRAYSEMDWQLMNDLLHKLKGSAKICAATLLLNAIDTAQNSIKNNGILIDNDMLQLLNAIEVTSKHSS